jgi:hypothetical protein
VSSRPAWSAESTYVAALAHSIAPAPAMLDW